MKALYATASGQFGLVHRPKPVPGPSDVLVRVARASVCHTDVVIRTGKADHCDYPVIPGHEFCGVVVECGTAVTDLRPGNRVVARTILHCGACPPCLRGRTNWCENFDELGSKSDGGFAEYCVVPARHAIRLPESMSDTAGAMVEPLANAVAAVTQAGIEDGDRVLVIGPGPIGYLALQVARLCQPSVLVLAGTRDSRLRLGQTLGADHTVNVRQPDASDRIREMFAGKGADAVLECAGSASALDLALEHVGVLGRIAVEGVPDASARLTLAPYPLFIRRSIRLLGVTGWNAASFAEAVGLLGRDAVQVNPLVTQTFSLDQWETAFEMVTERKDECIKVQFEFEAPPPESVGRDATTRGDAA